MINTKVLPNKGRIKGAIKDKKTLSPLEKVHVVANGSVEDYTNAQGEYTLEGVLSGLVMIQTYSEGYGAELSTVELVSGGTVTHDFQVTSGAPLVTSVMPADSAFVSNLDSEIVVEFDSAIDTSSINDISFGLGSVDSSLAGDFIKTENSFIFRPKSPLLPGTDYYALLTIDVMNDDDVRLAKDYEWMFTTKTPTLQDNKNLVPCHFDLLQNYPNPFNSSTIIKYHLPTAGHVKINIYDIHGRFIKALLNEPQTAGVKSIKWDGSNSEGKMVSSGTYFYQIKYLDNDIIKQMLFVK